MDLTELAGLMQPADTRILLLVLDGLGGLPMASGGRTELETARTPNLDALLREGRCGLHQPVAPGITPGSGPGHLGLFGYDPLRYRIGRGVLEALGVEFDLQPGDVAARGNFCTVDAHRRITDRRAGRILTEESVALCERLDRIEIAGAEIFVRPVKEHRFLLVLRPQRPAAVAISDTDPERTGVEPLPLRALSAGSQELAEIAGRWLEAVGERLAGEPRANMVLLRGFAQLPEWPKFPDIFGVRALAAAAYPMYRGVARLVGMDAAAVEDRLEALAERVERQASDYDFFFLHVKETDKAGEDGDFGRKVQVIEAVDDLVPRLLAVRPDVVLVTGDHSTPARLRSHSWHPVPFLLYGGPGRPENARKFGESSCAESGRCRACELMPLAMAAAGRLAKFGA